MLVGKISAKMDGYGPLLSQKYVALRKPLKMLDSKAILTFVTLPTTKNPKYQQKQTPKGIFPK